MVQSAVANQIIHRLPSGDFDLQYSMDACCAKSSNKPVVITTDADAGY